MYQNVFCNFIIKIDKLIDKYGCYKIKPEQLEKIEKLLPKISLLFNLVPQKFTKDCFHEIFSSESKSWFFYIVDINFKLKSRKED